MSLFQPYRPRRPTRAENEKNEEQLQYNRERQGKKRARERERLEERSSKMQFSEHNGIGYQDYTLGPSGQIKTRGQLDRRAYAQHRSTLETNDRPFLDSVPTLADCCLDLVAENYGEPGQLDKIDRYHHIAHVKPLFDRVRRIRKDEESRLPFEFWLEFAFQFGLDLPSCWKTYRGLVVTGDQEELELIKDYNEEAVRQWILEPSFAPSFFLATLDLSNDATFTDADVYKLRNPLSSFLAVLKLDKTAITDIGVTWIARVAADGEAYKHLEVLSLKGLTRVTNDGAARLSTLSNLRMLDLRNTQCDSKIVQSLNNVGGEVPFVPCQPRKGVRNTLIEFQLFGGSLSSSRILSSLHYLAKVLHSPGTTRYATSRLPLVKPLSVHLSAMTRKATLPLASPVDKTAEQLYQEQLTLSGFSGSARATHHTAFGTLTSTKSLARKLVADDGRAMNEKGAAFRNGVGDSVAAGEYVGAGKVGGRASLFEVGTRKLTVPGRKMERDPFSDTEDEAEKEKTSKEEEAEELRMWEEKTNTGFSFYAGRKPVPRPERVIVASAESVFILLRHLPYVSPLERPKTVSRPAEQASTTTKEVETNRRVVQEGATLLKKKRRVEDTSSPRPLLSPSSSPAPLPLARSKPSFPPPSSNVSSRSSASTPSCAQPRSTPSNPFAKKQNIVPKSAARTASKNIIKCTPVLAKRSSLSAFKR